MGWCYQQSEMNADPVYGVELFQYLLQKEEMVPVGGLVRHAIASNGFESVMSTNSITLALCMVINVVLMHGIIAMRRAYTTTF